MVRECTDIACSVLWLVAIGIVFAVIVVGTHKPERHDFLRLTNDRGVQCGVYDEVGKDGGFGAPFAEVRFLLVTLLRSL